MEINLADSVLTCLLGKLPYSGSLPQCLFEEVMIKHYFSLGMVSLSSV